MPSHDGQPPQLPPSSKKPPGTWTPLETFHLIDSYQETWYALKRGQLRTPHWVQVAEALAARCAGHPDASVKSSVQCRHKLEKLRRRYRSERQICLRDGPGSSQWPFFDRMDLMERGPAAIAAPGGGGLRISLPFSDLELQKRIGPERDFIDHESTRSDEGGGGEEEEDAEDSDQPPPKIIPNRKRSHHHHRPLEDEDGFYSSLNKKHSAYNPSFNKKGENKNPRISEKPSSNHSHSHSHARATESAPYSELVSLIASFGEAFLRMEQMKIQMQRETERFRVDMEVRRTEMVLQCQKQIAELFTKALFSSKKIIETPLPAED